MLRLEDATTFLFVPGDRPLRFEKATRSGVHAVILDLEDSLPPAMKSEGRAAVATYAATERVVVRVNAEDTPWFADDLDSLVGSSVAGIMLPKAGDETAIAEIADRLPGVPILPLIETAQGFSRLAQLVAVSPSVCRLVFGTIDFQLDLGIEEVGDELLAFRSQIVLHSRVAGLAAPVDGVHISLGDDNALMHESRRAKRLGFGGKLCIHPNQVPVVANVFRPTDQEVERAAEIVQAAKHTPSGAFTVAGRMIDRPVIALAEKTLARAQLYQMRLPA